MYTFPCTVFLSIRNELTEIMGKGGLFDQRFREIVCVGERKSARADIENVLEECRIAVGVSGGIRWERWPMWGCQVTFEEGACKGGEWLLLNKTAVFGWVKWDSR
jgi:hypothetical protein